MKDEIDVGLLPTANFPRHWIWHLGRNFKLYFSI
jgi:hypothetical protein